MRRCKQNITMILHKAIRKGARFLIGLGCVIVVSIWAIYQLYWLHKCRHVYHTKDRPHFICTSFSGRTGNLMFQYAFMYGYSKSKKLTRLLPEGFPLLNMFEIPEEDIGPAGYSASDCGCFYTYEDKYDCALDNDLETLPSNRDYNFKGFFQSWKYWKGYSDDLHKIFTLKLVYKTAAQTQLRNIVQFECNVKNPVLVGVHIRQGDIAHKASFINFGYRLATKEYLLKAMTYFRNKYPRVCFIAATNSPSWTREAIASEPNVYILQDNPPELDFAVLTLTNHTIMTVGTFGWWISWMTNGTTVYYKHPFREGTDFASQFDHRFNEDHVYPGWIGME